MSAPEERLVSAGSVAGRLGRADAMAEADALEAGGQLLAAIDALSAVNRDRRRPEIERRLVELRYRAFDELDRTEGRDTWPPTPPDLFPASSVPPEISLPELTTEVVASGIVHHGSLIVRGLLSPDRIAQLRDDVQRAFAGREAAQRSISDASVAPWFVPFAPGRDTAEGFGNQAFIRAVDSPPTMFDLTEAYIETGLERIVKDHFGERPAVAAHKCVLRRIVHNPKKLLGGGFHQDGAFLGAGIRALNMWLALSDCGGEAQAPGLDVVPRRIPHVLETGTDGAMFPWAVSPVALAEASRSTPIVRPEFAPGDAMFFDELLVHSTGMSQGMTLERLGIECWFFAPSRYPPAHVPAVF